MHHEVPDYHEFIRVIEVLDQAVWRSGNSSSTAIMSRSEAILIPSQNSNHGDHRNSVESSPLHHLPFQYFPMESTQLAGDALESRLAASMKRNHALEEENERLRQQVSDLKSQIAASSLVRVQDAERIRSSLSSTKVQKYSVVDDKVPPIPGGAAGGLFPGRKGPPPSLSPAPKGGATRVPNPAPRPSSDASRPMPKAGGKEAPPPPPPPPLLSARSSSTAAAANAVRRVPEVIELYRALTRREARSDGRHGGQGSPAVNSREMIGEIENRSSHLLAIKSDVETHGDFIRLLTKQVQNAAYGDISDVDASVRWLDSELSYLVDERAVLKHFPQWPERKADAMREAACSYRDMKSLEAEVVSYRPDDPGQPTSVALKRMQALQDKLEQSVHNLERARESAKLRYREFQIPWEWMLDGGMVAQLKTASMKLARDYVRRVVITLQSRIICEEEDLMLQGVRFAFRVHQFAGGFDQATREAFQELRKVASRHFSLSLPGQLPS